jgi:hypothetical protein
MSVNKKLHMYISISAFFRGDQLDPDYISEALKIQPADSQKKGEKRKGVGPNSKAVTKIGIWRFSIKSESRTVASLVDEMLQMFEGRQEPLDKIAGVDEAYLDILILNHKKEMDNLDNTAEFILSKDQILRLSQLGLAICVTVS